MKPQLKWIFGSVLFALACFAAFASRGLWAQPKAVRFAEPIQTLRLDDSSKLEILQIGVGEVVDGGASAKSGIFGGLERSSGYRGGSGCTISYVADKEVLQELKFTASNPEALVLEVKDKIRGTKKRLQYNNRVEVISGTSQSSHKKFAGVDAMLAGEEVDGLPDLLIQVRSSEGKWLNSFQSGFCDKDPEQRTVFIFKAWPRAEAILEFRAIRPGVAPYEFSIRNPDQVRSAKTWTVQSLPAVYSDADCQFSLTSLECSEIANEGVKLVPAVELESKVYAGGELVEEAFTYALDGVEGNWGSEGKYVDPSNTQFRFKYSVWPSSAYPYERKNAVIVAQAKVDADGKLKAIKKLKTAVPVKKITLTPSADGFSVETECEWRKASEMQKTLRALGLSDWYDVKACVFINGSSHSLASIDSVGGGSSQSGDHVEADSEWRVECDLKPGQVVEFGFVAPVGPKRFSFVVERSE